MIAYTCLFGGFKRIVCIATWWANTQIYRNPTSARQNFHGLKGNFALFSHQYWITDYFTSNARYPSNKIMLYTVVAGMANMHGHPKEIVVQWNKQLMNATNICTRITSLSEHQSIPSLKTKHVDSNIQIAAFKKLHMWYMGICLMHTAIDLLQHVLLS